MNAVFCFECEHCGLVSRHQRYMKGHEKRCVSNPTHRACKSCRYWFRNSVHFGRAKMSHVQLPFCANPVDDYSYMPPHYEGDGEGNMSQSQCEGWKPVPVHRKRHKKAFKMAGTTAKNPHWEPEPWLRTKLKKRYIQYGD